MSVITVHSTRYPHYQTLAADNITAFHAINDGITISMKDGRAVGTRDDLFSVLAQFKNAVSAEQSAKTPVLIEQHTKMYDDQWKIVSVQKAKAWTRACEF